MPKQSVRGGKNGFYQPSKYKTRTKSYVSQIKSQLPKDFKPFQNKVYIEMLEFMFAPTKKIQRVKYKMKHLNEGGIYEKTTKPDLSDNLKKLLLDSMGGLVFKDDSIICRENNVSKVYGIEGQITIILNGE